MPLSLNRLRRPLNAGCIPCLHRRSMESAARISNFSARSWTGAALPEPPPNGGNAFGGRGRPLAARATFALPLNALGVVGKRTYEVGI